MSSEKYFIRELNYLQQAGEQFAEQHQEIAGELRLTGQQRKDPFVERLIEAFAFLAGSIHERLDDDFPEFTGGLLEQLLPHFLKPFPSCAILQAQALPGAINSAIGIEKGQEVQTSMMQIKYKDYFAPGVKDRIVEKKEPAEFIFTTCFNLTVRPLGLKKVSFLEKDKNNHSVLILHIQPYRNTTYETLKMDHLRLYLNQRNPRLAYRLLHALINEVESVEVGESGAANKSCQHIKDFKITIPGLNEDDYDNYEIIPYARQTFSGYRLLHEYFCFKERFFFIDIEGLEQFDSDDEAKPFEIRFIFRDPVHFDIKPTEKDILLHCTPVINLFERDTEPVVLNHQLPEYQIIPDKRRRKSLEIFSIKNVAGINEEKDKQYMYLPVTSYDKLDKYNPSFRFKRFYSSRSIRDSQKSLWDTYIRIAGELSDDELGKESLSINALLSNGYLVAENVQPGQINQPVSFPTGIQVKNISQPTEVHNAPQKEDYLWSLLAHLNLSFTSLSNTEMLKSILSLYNWSISHNNPDKKRIDAIKKVAEPQTKSIFRDGTLLRAVEFPVEFDSTLFEFSEGDYYLFGLVLSRFLTQYTTINTHVILKMKDINTKQEFSWNPKQGQNYLL